MSHILKDAGEREVNETGYQREPNGGRGRYELISPIMLRRLAVLYEKGASKYAARNWEKGGNLSRFLNSALRHTLQYLEGYRDEDHLVQAIWNLTCIVHIEEMIERGLMPEEFDDLPNYFGEEKDD